MTRCIRVTPMELRVWRSAAMGEPTGETARGRGCSARTIDNHRQRLMGKLGVRNRIELVVLGLRLGVVTLRDIQTPDVAVTLPAEESL